MQGLLPPCNYAEVTSALSTAAPSPSASTPARRPGSIRRTTSHDTLRPDGLLGPLRTTALGRDLYTDADGRADELASARLDVGVTAMPDWLVSALAATPSDPRLEALVGRPARSGFRRVLEELLPDERSSLRYQLLDDLPTAVLVSGVALYDEQIVRPTPASSVPKVDLCAGWAADGMLMGQINAGQAPREPRVRPPAPDVTRSSGDPLAWHEVDDLPATGMRRIRRTDVWLSSASSAAVDAFFRDVYCDNDAQQRVVHEYTLTATLDLPAMTFTSCVAGYGSLPWPECPQALASAGRLVGTSVHDLRMRVRSDFTGTSTCTHLNDVLRSLEDLPGLVAALDA